MLIAIEGCLGAGKTTVARGLAAYRGSETLVEAFELNPFLRAFYKDPSGSALETEFSFLLLHYHQLRTHVAAYAQVETVADFHLGKDLIYADLTLAEDAPARSIFGDLYEVCQARVPTPDLLVCLSIDTELLLRRIRARSRDFEMEIDPDYYVTLNGAYQRFFAQYGKRKLHVDMDEWDFVADPTRFKALALAIDSEIGLRK